MISKYSKDNMYRMDGYLGGHVLERPYTSDKVYGKVGEQEARDIDDNHQRYRDIRFDLLRSLLANKKAVFGSVVILLFILVAILAPYIAPYSYDAVDLPNMLKAPSVSHPLGTDELGRDIFSRIIYGARVSLKSQFVFCRNCTDYWCSIRALAGYFGGVVDYIISGLTDIVWSFPVTLLAIAFVAALRLSLTNLILALALTGWTGFTRLVRGEFLAIRRRNL